MINHDRACLPLPFSPSSSINKNVQLFQTGGIRGRTSDSYNSEHVRPMYLTSSISTPQELHIQFVIFKTPLPQTDSLLLSNPLDAL